MKGDDIDGGGLRTREGARMVHSIGVDSGVVYSYLGMSCPDEALYQCIHEINSCGIILRTAYKISHSPDMPSFCGTCDTAVRQ